VVCSNTFTCSISFQVGIEYNSFDIKMNCEIEYHMTPFHLTGKYTGCRGIFSRFLRIIGIYLHQTTLCHFLEICNVKMNCTWWSVLRQNIFQPENVEYCDFFDKHIATNISLFNKALKEWVSLKVCAHIQMCLVVTFSDTNLVHLLHKILLQN
jgi:hypothetical protein